MSQAGPAPHDWPCALSSSAEAPQPDVNCTIAGLHVSQPVKLCGGGLSIPTGIAFMYGSCPATSPAHRPARQRQPNKPPFSSAPLLPTSVHALTAADCRWHQLFPAARSGSPPGLAAPLAALQPPWVTSQRAWLPRVSALGGAALLTALPAAWAGSRRLGRLQAAAEGDEKIDPRASSACHSLAPSLPPPPVGQRCRTPKLAPLAASPFWQF